VRKARGPRLDAARRRLDHAWLQVVIEQLPDAVKLLDAEGRFVMLNRAAAALRCVDDGRRDPFGNRVDLDLWTPAGERLPPEALPHVRVLGGGAPIAGEELRVRLPDGHLLPVLANAVALRGPGGALLGATVVFRDVSAQKELEQMRTEWSAIVAHDLRQPASVVTLGAALLRRNHVGPMSEQEAKQLDRIESAAHRLSAMIEELLDTTRLEAKRMTITAKAVDVAALAREVCERTIDAAAGHRILVCEAGAPRAWADPVRVEQVIANLVSNASKYGAPGGEIRIDVDGGGGGGAVEVTVTNEGRGIAPDELPRLFQRFMRSHQSAAHSSGIGLGLYICKGLVEAQGGRIWVESTPDATTSFHFTLPAAS
jgi:signal transduction histidine kinase